MKEEWDRRETQGNQKEILRDIMLKFELEEEGRERSNRNGELKWRG